MKQKYSKISLATAALALPTAFLVGNMTSLVLKANNPDKVDITAGLAYLRPILIVSFTTFGILCLVSLISAVIGMRSSDKNLSKFSLFILIAMLLISLGAGLLQTRTDQIERNYSQKQFNTLFQQLQSGLK